MKEKKLYIIASFGSLSARTRMYKICNFLKNRYHYTFYHIAWERIPDETEEKLFSFPIEKKVILSGGGYKSIKSRAMYILWMIKLFFFCLFRIENGSKIWALSFESAFPAVVANLFNKKFEIYFDDADRFSMSFKFPKPVVKIIEILEKYTSRNVTLHIIPGIERYDYPSNRFFILKNFPSEIEIEKAKLIYEEKKNTYITSQLVLNVNGYMRDTRGLEQVCRLAERYPEKLALIVAGKIDNKYEKRLLDNKNVQYLGIVSNAEALASYYASDLVVTYFAPEIFINNFAESNKWGDAIKTGIGILVNSEVITAKEYIDEGVAIANHFHDYDALYRNIEELLQNPNKILLLKEKIAIISDRYPYFEDGLEQLYNKIK